MKTQAIALLLLMMSALPSEAHSLLSVAPLLTPAETDAALDRIEALDLSALSTPIHASDLDAMIFAITSIAGEDHFDIEAVLTVYAAIREGALTADGIADDADYFLWIERLRPDDFAVVHAHMSRLEAWLSRAVEETSQ
ncbi:MAG: hypothetical protein ACU0BN_08435 [Sulfitobacter sp.]